MRMLHKRVNTLLATLEQERQQANKPSQCILYDLPLNMDDPHIQEQITGIHAAGLVPVLLPRVKDEYEQK